jgi:hypothetical protein
MFLYGVVKDPGSTNKTDNASGYYQMDTYLTIVLEKP